MTTTLRHPGLAALFPNVSRRRLLDFYFPSRFLLHHGSIERLGKLASESALRSSAELAEIADRDIQHGLTCAASELSLPHTAEWTEAIRRDLGLRADQISCNVIYSPKGSGTKKHLDGVEGLTIQMFGKKRWRVKNRRELPIPYEVGVDPSTREMASNSRQYTLRPGSACFLPRGWWHDTIAVEHSISFHFELRVDCWISAITRLLTRRLIAEQVWREPIACASSRQRNSMERRWRSNKKNLIHVISSISQSDFVPLKS